MRLPEDIKPISLRRHPEAWWIASGSLLLFFLRFGYGYGTSDQDEIIPFLLHRLHPNLFTEDWFVMTQVSEFGIRAYFVTMLQSFAVFLPPWLAVLLLFIVTWLLTATALYALGLILTQNRIAAATGVILILVMTLYWTLGGNDLATWMLVPSNVAWCLALWGVVMMLNRHALWAGILLGLSTWMQALVGLQMAGMLGLVWLLEALYYRRPKDLRMILTFSIAYLLSALPSLGPLIYQQLGTDSQPDPNAPSLFYIMGVFRNPHHYLFHAFSPRSKPRFGIIAVLGAISFLWLHRKHLVWHGRLLLQLLGIIFLLCLTGYVFTEISPSLFIAKLQLFKATVLAKTLFLIFISGAVATLLPKKLRWVLDKLLDEPRIAWAGVGIAYLLVITGILLQVNPFYRNAHPLAQRDTPIHQLELWAQTNTQDDALFAVPPSWAGFRSHALRAIVINAKAFPYRDALIYTWFERLTDVAPAPLPDQPAADLQARLDSAFLHQPVANLHHTAMRYDADYVVQDRVLEDARFAEVFRATPWIVYEVISPATEAE